MLPVHATRFARPRLPAFTFNIPLLSDRFTTTLNRHAPMPKRSAPLSSLSTHFVSHWIKTHPLYTGILATPEDQEQSPDVILIFGWFGAQHRHLQKYTSAYTQLYPNASQIVVRCDADLFWTTADTRQLRLMPVIDTLEAFRCLPSSSCLQRRPRILTHVLSNGGSLQMLLLRDMLLQKYGSALVEGPPTSALIFDSSPSVDNTRSFTQAFSIVFPNPVVRVIAFASAYMPHITHTPDRLSLITAERMMTGENLYVELQNPHILPWMGLHTPRLYLLSRKDKITPWQDITRHAETAEQRGMDVYCELFEESGHVAHIRAEPERYWSSILEVWRAAVSKERSKYHK